MYDNTKEWNCSQSFLQLPHFSHVKTSLCDSQHAKELSKANLAFSTTIQTCLHPDSPNPPPELFTTILDHFIDHVMIQNVR